MLGRTIGRLPTFVSAASFVGLGLSAVWAAGGGVTISTDLRTYPVGGTTALALLRYMDTHPVQGDHGAAYASIHPDYQLLLATTQRGSMCVPQSVSVNVAFTETVPEASSRSAMNGRTRAAWDSFAAFTRAHEAHHKASYIACATAFVLQAQRQSASECFALESSIRGMLAQMKRDCEAKQVPFDRAQARVLVNLRLFSMARYQSFR